MRIARIEHQRYQVPFRVPFTTSHGTDNARCGVLVRITTEDGVIGLGEAAPLPSFGTGTLDDTERHMYHLKGDLQGQELGDVPVIMNRLAGDRTAAPISFALDTAALDAEASYAGVPLARFLNAGAACTVPVNATIGASDIARAVEVSRRAVTAGYTAIKLKVGTLRDLDDEVARIGAVRDEIGPDIELRLDANGAWSLDQARTALQRLDDLNISYVEQPLPAEELAGTVRLRSEVDIPIAADEAATTTESVRELIELGAVDVLIVKPGVVGGLRRSREIIELAEGAGIEVVITTALETGVGVVAALHLAATLPQPVPACGLATGSLIESDLLVESPVTRNGHMTLPSGTGLGVDVVPGEWE